MSTCSVIVATCDVARMPLLQRTVDSVFAQKVGAGRTVELVIAVDHDEDLLATVRTRFPTATSVLNRGERGASATRNAGARAASGQYLVFIDDDAAAAPDWLPNLLAPLLDRRDVVGVGGWVDPAWERHRPVWFPPQFDWVVGASYAGQPRIDGPVRNTWSENMAVRATDFWRVGGFREGFGKVGQASRPEDTELCLRMVAARPGASWWLAAGAVVHHHVPTERATYRFFLRRCRAEGAGKAALARIAGSERALASERSYTTRVLPHAVLVGVLDAVRGRPAGGLRAVTMLLGLAAALAGFVGEVIRRPIGTPTPSLQRTSLPAKVAPGMPLINRPARITQIDVADPVPSVGLPGLGEPADVIALVTLCGRPAGLVRLRPGTSDEVARQIGFALREELTAEANHHDLSPEPLTPAGWLHTACPARARRARCRTGPAFTVVVCTRNRPEQLRRCLASLAHVDYEDWEVLVVDNAPVDERTLRATDAARPALAGRLRYIREPRPGLSHARNRALRESSHELVAFVDDDEVVDRHWLAALAEEFTDPDVGAVTGIVLPAELSTTSAVRFEEWGGHAKGRGFARTVMDQEHQRRVQSPVYPRPTFGAGANMAFRRCVLEQIGGFDTHLGAGSRVGGGEDTLALTETMLAGHTVIYSPAPMTWHHHRGDESALVVQLAGYATGLGAYYAALVARNPARLWVLATAAARSARRRHGPGRAFVPPPAAAVGPRGIRRGWQFVRGAGLYWAGVICERRT